MGDVVSSHLDESRREMITGRTRTVMSDFGRIFEQQYSVSLFNTVRAEIEGAGGTQTQLLHRKDALEGRNIFSGSLLQYLEENRKWRNRYVSIPNSYTIDFYESKNACERGLQPKVRINCAGYKVLTSLEQYMELMNDSLPDVNAKSSPTPFIKTVSPYTLILWHPFARHHYFCVLTDKEHSKWSAVLQDCVRHANNGLPEESTVLTPAFTNSVRLYRQAQGHYGSWDLMCGTPPQILANLVMEQLHPDLRSAIGPRLKGKLQQRHRSWMLISGAVYRQVLTHTTLQYEALSEGCESKKGPLDAALRTDMDQLISTKDHVSGKIRAMILPKSEQLLKTSVQPYVSSILEALMEPTSRGFSEVRDVFSRELVELSKNSVDQDREKLGECMERVSMLAFHPVKMRPCYDQMERVELEGLQERFSVSGPSLFSSRGQILMREQMDNAIYTFEQLLNQALEAEGETDLCKSIQKCQERVLKKFDYDSSTVRKKFFREALLQIIVPYMLQQLEPSCSPELPQFQELIFEDFSKFLLVENLYEDVVIQSVSNDIMSVLKEAAVQRKHNLYRDSIVMSNSDPNLQLLGQDSPVDWSKLSTEEQASPTDPSDPSTGTAKGSQSGNKRRQVVSMIQLDGVPLPYESCMDVPGVDLIPEEEDGHSSQDEGVKSPDSVNQIRGLINPMVEVVLPVSDEAEVIDGTETKTGVVVMKDGIQEEVTHVTTKLDKVPRSSVKIQSCKEPDADALKSPIQIEHCVKDKRSTEAENGMMGTEKLSLKSSCDVKSNAEVDGPKQTLKSPTETQNFTETEEANQTSPGGKTSPTHLENGEKLQRTDSKTETTDNTQNKKSPHSLLERLMGSKRQEEEAAIKSAIHELEIAVLGEEDDSDPNMSAPDSDSDQQRKMVQSTDYSSQEDSGFQSLGPEGSDSARSRQITNGQVDVVLI